RVTPAAETVVTPAAEAVAPVASQPGGPSASEQLKTTGNASPSTVTNAGTETPAVTAPAVEEPLGDGRSQRVVVQQPADDDPKAAWSRHYGGATVRAARPTGRRRARAAAASTTAPAPRWTPGPDADAGAEGSANSAGPTAADDLPDVTGLTTAGQETRKQPPRRDAVKAGGWYEDQGDPEKPEPREKLLTRWSNTMRSKFGRMLPRRHDDDFGPDDPYDLDRRTVAAPTVEPPDDDEPIAEEATSGEKKPWFRIFRR
ncbi:MAG TPA: hypothetical protein VGX78_15970, partial [Pirellulales bacterium]|nr:hypothetical protein [Pirellulales bacterium]